MNLGVTLDPQVIPKAPLKTADFLGLAFDRANQQERILGKVQPPQLGDLRRRTAAITGGLQLPAVAAGGHLPVRCRRNRASVWLMHEGFGKSLGSSGWLFAGFTVLGHRCRGNQVGPLGSQGLWPFRECLIHHVEPI